MDHDHLVELVDASWKHRCNERMEELKNTQFSSQDEASKPALLHKELVGNKKLMTSKLHKAVENGNVDIFVDELKQECIQGKSPLCDILDQVNETGDSLLHVAAYIEREQISELICEHFPKLLIRRNVGGDTPLHVAVRSRNSNIVKLILYAIGKSKHDDWMKDKNLTREENEHGNTPLHEAVYSQQVDVVKDILFVDEFVVHYLNKYKRSPLYLAVVTGNKEILNLLLQIPFPADKSLPLCHGNSPLHAAIREQNPVLINAILAKRPELVYLKDEDGGTPLHYAAYTGYVEGVRLLLKNSLEKLDQTALEVNKKGYLPIHLASEMGHVKVVKEFLEHGFNPYVLLNQKGQNILHVAAKNGKADLVLILLRHRKIDEFTINQKDNDGNTPLHLAAENLFPLVLFSITRDKRTNVKLSNNNGSTARDIVGPLNNQKTLRKFVAYYVLKNAGVPMKELNMGFDIYQLPGTNLNIKDLINTCLIVATLMVTVSFTAAFTVPGGVYASDDPDPKKRGIAVFAHEPLFGIFTTFNMISMYSSVFACGLLLVAIYYGPKLAVPAIIVAINCLVVSFLTVPVTFLTAVHLVVPNTAALHYVIIVFGVVCTSLILLVLFFVIFPYGIDFPPFRQVETLNLVLLSLLAGWDFEPKDLSPHKANKDKDSKLEKHVQQGD